MSNLTNNVLIYGKTPISTNCFGCYFYQQICSGSVYNIGDCGSGDLISKQKISAILSALMLNHLDNNTLLLHKVLGGNISDIQEEYSSEEIQFAQNFDESKIDWIREKFYDEHVFLSEDEDIHIHEEESEEQVINIETYFTVMINTKFFKNENGFAVLNNEISLEDFNKTSKFNYSESDIENIKNEIGFSDLEHLFIKPQFDFYTSNNSESFSFDRPDLSEDPFENSRLKEIGDDDDLPF